MFIVIEIQTNADGTIGTLVTPCKTEAEANHKYHEILAAASISQIPKHSAVMLTDEGDFEKSEKYIH